MGHLQAFCWTGEARISVAAVSGNFPKIKNQRGRKGAGGWHGMAWYSSTSVFPELNSGFRGNWDSTDLITSSKGKWQASVFLFKSPACPGSRWTGIISNAAQQVAVQPAQLALLYLEVQCEVEPSSETQRFIFVHDTCRRLQSNTTVKAHNTSWRTPARKRVIEQRCQAGKH